MIENVILDFAEEKGYKYNYSMDFITNVIIIQFYGSRVHNDFTCVLKNINHLNEVDVICLLKSCYRRKNK